MNENNNQSKGWFDFDRAMRELKADENKVYLDSPSKKKEEPALEQENNFTVPFHDFSQDPVFRRQEARKRRQQKLEENERIKKETRRLKIFDTLPKKVMSIVIAGTLAGVVGFTAKAADNTYTENLNSPSIEQEYTQENSVSKASDLAEKATLTQDEVKLVQDVNEGKYYEAPAIGQFGTEQGYTPLSEDPNYKEPNLEELGQIDEEASLDKAMDKFQKGEALSQEEVRLIQDANTNPEQAPVGHFDNATPLSETQGKTM